MRRETKKKLLAWLLCICLALQLAPQIFAAEPQTQASAEESRVAQDYAITIARQLQLQSLACAANGENIDLLDANGKVRRRIFS